MAMFAIKFYAKDDTLIERINYVCGSWNDARRKALLVLEKTTTTPAAARFEIEGRGRRK